MSDLDHLPKDIKMGKMGDVLPPYAPKRSITRIFCVGLWSCGCGHFLVNDKAYMSMDQAIYYHYLLWPYGLKP
jgi:hypothetical protein